MQGHFPDCRHLSRAFLLNYARSTITKLVKHCWNWLLKIESIYKIVLWPVKENNTLNNWSAERACSTSSKKRPHAITHPPSLNSANGQRPHMNTYKPTTFSKVYYNYFGTNESWKQPVNCQLCRALFFNRCENATYTFQLTRM